MELEANTEYNVIMIVSIYQFQFRGAMLPNQFIEKNYTLNVPYRATAITTTATTA